MRGTGHVAAGEQPELADGGWTKRPGGLLKPANRKVFGYDNPAEPFGSFLCVQISDTQFGLNSWLKRWKKGDKECSVNEELESLTADFNPRLSLENAYKKEVNQAERAIAVISKMRPKPLFVVLTGNPVNATVEESQLPDRQKQLADWRACFEKLDPSIGMMVLPGERDVLEVPTRKSIEAFSQDFGDDYFELWCRNVRVFALNTNLFRQDWPEGSEQRQLAEEHMSWLEAKVKDGQPSHGFLILSAIPPFIETHQQKDGYWVIAGCWRTRLLDLFTENAKICTWIAGHYHSTVEPYGARMFQAGHQSGGGLMGGENEWVFYKHMRIIVTGAVGTTLFSKTEGPGALVGTYKSAFVINNDLSCIHPTWVLQGKYTPKRQTLVNLGAKLFMMAMVFFFIVVILVGIIYGYGKARADGFDTQPARSSAEGCSLKWGCPKKKYKGNPNCIDDDEWAVKTGRHQIRGCEDLKKSCEKQAGLVQVYVKEKCKRTCNNCPCKDDDKALKKATEQATGRPVPSCAALVEMLKGYGVSFCSREELKDMCCVQWRGNDCDAVLEEAAKPAPCCADDSCADNDEMAKAGAEKQGMTGATGCGDLAKYCAMSEPLKKQLCPVTCDACAGAEAGAGGGDAADAQKAATVDEKLCDENCEGEKCVDMDEAVAKAIKEKQNMTISGCPDIANFCSASKQLQQACAQTCEGCRNQ